MIWEDPIVSEVRCIREELAAQLILMLAPFSRT